MALEGAVDMIVAERHRRLGVQQQEDCWAVGSEGEERSVGKRLC